MNVMPTAITRYWPIAWAFAVLDRLTSLVFSDQRTGNQPRPLSRSNARNCVLVLDASGSMMSKDWEPSRLEAAKKAAQRFCDRLHNEHPETAVAIVAYGDSSKRYCGLTQASNSTKLARAISRIDCLGCTNIRKGLEAASRILRSYSLTQCQVVLLTDGHNTERSPRNVAEKLRSFAVVDCVGIGGSPSDVDEALLKDLASANPDGSKRYRWIGDKDRLVEHFNSLAGRIKRA